MARAQLHVWTVYRASPHPTSMVRIGTAGWSVPPQTQRAGSHLQHYSQTLSCVEVNSSFYRPHRAATWARWAADTPHDFRFAIKAPRTITHEQELRDTKPLLVAFLDQIGPLGNKAGPLLLQLPPSLAFDFAVAEDFLALLRSLYQGEAALEPRHATWFTAAAAVLLQEKAIARVAADPPTGGPQAAEPGGDGHLIYYRLHGQPRTYYSNYDDAFLKAFAGQLAGRKNVWVIFDNTAMGCAYGNALLLRTM